MAGIKGMKRYSPEIIDKAKKLFSSGKKYSEIADILGYEKMKIKRLLEREKSKEKKMLLGIEIKPKGRPKKESLSEYEKMVLKIETLKAENELLRSFLKVVGRM